MTAANTEPSKPAQDQGGELLGFARFPVCLDSPFADGYDIAAERIALADLVTGKNPDKSDPRWARFIELCDREVELLHLSQRHMPHTGSASLTPQTNPTEPIKIGQLTDAEPDTMTLHTKDAFRLVHRAPGRFRRKGGVYRRRQALRSGAEVDLVPLGQRQPLRRLDSDPDV